VGRASSAKRARREQAEQSGGRVPNLWQKPSPVAGDDPREVIAGLEHQIAQLEAQRHAIHADDRRVASAAAQHHDRSRDQARHVGDDLARDPDDELLARAHMAHLRERRGAEEVHRQVSTRMREFRPKV
jgi:hypothetical protein